MDGECHEPPDSQGKRDSRTVWRPIATLAERQHGVVAGRQLLAAGLSAKAIEYQLRTARLHRVQRGVYAVGHRRLSREGGWMAAILAAPGAVLSHRSAAELWELRERRGGRIHVTGPRRLHPRSSLVAHLRLLPGDERTVHNGIPTTTVPRTLLDIAATEGRGPLTRALREAHFRRLGKPAAALALLVARYPRARGTRIAADVLAARAFTARTRSELEAAFLEFLAAEGIEPPETNVRVVAAGESFEVDCLWPARRLIAELDGAAAHLGSGGFEADRRRDGILQSSGYRVYRLTWRRLHGEPVRVAAELCDLLARGAA